MNLATVVAGVAAAVSAAVGLIFAGRQLRIANKQHGIDQRVAHAGVAVSWHAVEGAVRAGADGLAQWLYVIAVRNPGKLPIQNVMHPLDIPFRCHPNPLRRQPRPANPALTMGHPVLAGRASGRDASV